MLTWIAGFFILIVKLTIVLFVVLFIAAYLVWVERKFLARLQIRYGPNRAGTFGLLQPVADIVKMIAKEDTVPDGADRALFLIAPAVVATTAFLMFSVVPFGGEMTLWGHKIPLVVTDLNIGLLFVFAMSSLGVYGVALGGWASNSKYGLLGGIRGAAQMISYELPLGLSLIPVVMMAHSFSMVDIVQSQQRYPFIIFQPLAFLIFVISAMAESKRTPFDLPEAESELVAGYHTEYSGMRFGLFFLGEYVQHDGLRRHSGSPVPGRLARAVFASVRLAPYKNISGCLIHDLGAGHASTAQVRSAHGLGVEGPDPPGPYKYPGYRRGGDSFWFLITN